MEDETAAARLELGPFKEYIGTIMVEYHEKLLANLTTLKLDKVLKRKNPYLFKAKALLTADQIIKYILDAHLISQEEAIFGNHLEKIALYVCKEVYGGQPAGSEGIDMDFMRDGKRYLVSIKSGPNWANSGQIARMRDDFKKARKILFTHIHDSEIVFVNGCCYGQDSKPNKGDYWKLCGQRFWELISGSDTLYIDFIEPLDREAKKRTDYFSEQYAKVVNKFNKDFLERFCTEDNAVNWPELLKFNSGK